MKNKSKDKINIALICILLLGILLRVFFICKTDISLYQFDVGAGDLDNDLKYDELYKDYNKGDHEGRHIDYIMQIYQNKKLPSYIIGQFYHPPLHHFILASWLRAMDFVSNSNSFKLESMQIVTFVYSVVILLALYKILDEMNFDSKNKIIPMTLFAYYPIYIFLSGSINNDELVIMFSLLTYLYLLKWEKNQSYINTILLSMFLGLGLMTKTSIVVMGIPCIYVYFKKLIEYVDKDMPKKNLIVDLILFIAIVSSLGLWFQLKSLSQGLNTLGIIQPYESLSLKNYNLWERFGLTNIFVMNDINIWNYLIYSSLNFRVGIYNNIFSLVMAGLVVIMVIDIIYYFIKYIKEDILINITIIVWYLAYFYLNLSMPYICSMHARYVVVPISLGIIILARGYEKEDDKFMKNQIIGLTLGMSILSIIYFIVGC